MPRAPVEHGGVHGHSAAKVGEVVADHLRRESRQETRLQFCTRPIHAEIVVRDRGEQQEAVVRNAPGAHVGLDDAGGLAYRVGEVGAVGSDDQGQVRRMQEVEAAAQADHPFSMFNVGRARRLAHRGDVGQVAVQQRQ